MPALFDLSCLKVMGDSTQRRKRVFGILTDDPFSLKPFLHFLGKNGSRQRGFTGLPVAVPHSASGSTHAASASTHGAKGLADLVHRNAKMPRLSVKTSPGVQSVPRSPYHRLHRCCQSRRAQRSVRDRSPTDIGHPARRQIFPTRHHTGCVHRVRRGVA